MLDAFKIKEFDLEPIYASWTDAPQFLGKPKKDLPVGEWLDQIKAGCIQRKVPKEYWHKVAQHYMGEKSKARLIEVKTIMAKVHGGNYRWDWKKFRTAMENMGWDIDTSKTEAIRLKARSSSGSMWWLSRKADDKEPERPALVKSESSFWLSRSKSDDKEPERPVLVKSDSSFWRKKDDKENADRPPPVPAKDSKSTPAKPEPAKPSPAWTLLKKDDRERPIPVKSKSVSEIVTTQKAIKPPPPSRSNSLASVDSDAVTTIAQAPVWLLNACGALDFLTTEHPKVMTTLSAILITIGSIPAIPAISAGAGGTVLASGAAHAVGAIAVGVGSWLKAQQDGQVQVTGPKPNSTT
jgi:hypothetical protein